MFTTRISSRSLLHRASVCFVVALAVLVTNGIRSDAKRSAIATASAVNESMPALYGEEAVSHLQQQGLYSSLQEAMQAARYGPEWVTGTGIAGMDAAYEMKNAANHLRAYVSASELRVLPMTDQAKESWQLGMKLTSYGRGSDLIVVEAGEVKVSGNRVEINRDLALGTQRFSLVEWYENSAAGVEQGFNVAESPMGKASGEALRLVMECSGSLSPQLNGAGQSVVFIDGRTVLVYEKLKAVDATGKSLVTRMELEKGRLALVVEDAGAEYPLRIDPLFREQTKLIASDGAGGDKFGVPVAISGDTVVVAASSDDVGANADQGSAYVFVRSGLTWAEQAKLTASDGATSDLFGGSVAISGDTVVVGASSDDVGANGNQGSAYVFVRDGSTWTQQAQLTASDGAVSDSFGGSVAIGGDTVVIGARDADVGANAFQGSAYVFFRSGATWTQQAKLTASDGASDDVFGTSVAISGDAVVVGADDDRVGANAGQGSVYLFVRSGMAWTQQAHLTASDGAAVDQFGVSVAISGDTVVVGAYLDDIGANANQGSAYVFVRSGTTWTERQHLTASDGAADDEFGISVGISRDTIVIGARSDDVGANVDQGSAYIYICNWDQQQQLTASDGAASDEFGQSVSIRGDTVVVGAFLDDVGANAAQGSAYVFVRSGPAWTQQAKLTASDGAAGDEFGRSVAISGDTVVVGAFADDVGANANQGSAYVFVRSGTAWTQQAKLTASDGAANDQFAPSVAISGDTVVVGAALDDVGGITNQGSTYVFVRSGTIWTQQAQLTASDSAANDEFGISVAISGDTVVVGAALDNVGANADQGSAYVFVRSGTTWTEQQKLTASDGAASDDFGQSVAISGDTVVAGAFFDDVGVNGNQGSAYVFARNGISWTEQQKLTASDGSANDEFGNSVAISGDTVAVGAFLDDVGANANQGSAYVFVHSGVGWTERQKLSSPDGAASDQFGQSAAISGDTVVFGAPLDDVGANANQGSAYVFFTGCNTSPTIAAGNQIRQKGSAATSATIAAVDDGQDPIGYLTVSVVSAPTGISITGVTNGNGVISAQVAALCNATLGNNSVLLRVQDSEGATGDVTLYVNVTANSDPVVGAYPDASVLASNGTMVTPSVAPSDNGSIVQIGVTSPTYSGGLSVNSDSGIVTISNARPAGAHIITITVIDNCGSSASQAFLLTVTCQSITVNPSTIPSGISGSAYSQVFTQTGGIAPVTFSLTGTLPTGLSFTVGTATLSGTPSQVGSYPISVTATDRNNCAGSRNYALVISAPLAVWNGSASGDWHTATNWTPNAVPATYTDVLIPTGGVANQPTISASSSSINAMTIQSSRVLTINSALQLATAADVASAGTITGAGKLAVGGSTFTQNGAVSIASVEFSPGSHSLTGGGSFASGIATVLGGATVTLTSDHSISVLVINSGGSFDCSNQVLTLTGAGTAIFNSGSFTAAGSTVIYQGSVAQVVTDNIAYNNLTLNNGAGVSLAGDTTVSGQLNLITDLTSGLFTLTMPASGTSAGPGDVVGNVKRTGFTNGAPLSFGNPLNTIRFDSGTPPSDVNVNLLKSTPVGFPANTVSRTYAITPNGGSGFSTTLRLRYKDMELNGLSESTLELWRFNGSSWVSPAGAATRDTTQNWVEETGITAFSSWAIAGPSGPTLVELISFEATGYDNGAMLGWKTGYEVDNLGFRVYRQEGGSRTLLNQELVAGSALVAGSGTMLTAGRAYSFWVDAKDAGKDAAFWIEDIDLNGTSTWHGPVFAKQVGGTLPKRSLAESLSQVGRTRDGGQTRATESFAAVPQPPQPGSSSASVQQASLASSPAVKIGVEQAGWYHVAQTELIAAGLNPKTDPRTLRLFVDGLELPIYVAGEEDGQFDANDAVEFYGLGLNTSSTDTRVYWLIGGSQPGLRISKAPLAKGYPSGESFPYTVERRDRTIYFAALKNGDEENFFGAVISSSAIDQRLTINNVVESAKESAIVEVSVQGVTNLAHQVSLVLNGSHVGQLSFNGQSKFQQRIEVPHSMLREGENIVALQSINGPSDISLVHFIRITYQHVYRAENDALGFTAKPGETATVGGFTSKDVRVFDVTDERAIQELGVSIDQEKDGCTARVTAHGGGIKGFGSGERMVLALTDSKALQTANLIANSPSHLRDTGNSADYIIISNSGLIEPLKPLAALRSKQGFNIAIVDIEDIYDEFSFGDKSPQSIKDFLSYAQKSWKGKPRFVLLAGDATYDARDYLEIGDHDLVPTKLIDTFYMETASDDWFADFNNDGIAEMAVGRLPARSSEELATMVSKIISYEQSSPADEVLLVADANDGFDFEQASAELRSLTPGSLRMTQVNRGGVDAETARRSLFEALSRRQYLVNYVGHGSANQWRGNLLTSDDALAMRNEHLPMFVMMTCLNGYFQDPSLDSIGEALMKAERGGAVAVWASSGMTLPTDQATVNQALYRVLFSRVGGITIGEAVARAKAASSNSDVRRTWILLGDPAMTLKR